MPDWLGLCARSNRERHRQRQRPAQYGIDGLQIATLLAGVILLLLGLARLGAIIKFIPDPVIHSAKRDPYSGAGCAGRLRPCVACVVRCEHMIVCRVEVQR